jgi:hypothetical protein
MLKYMSYDHLAEAVFYTIPAVVRVEFFVYGEYTCCVFVWMECSQRSPSTQYTHPNQCITQCILKETMTITAIHYPLDVKVNNDHHGEFRTFKMPILESYPPPLVRSNMGKPRDPEDIELYYNYIAIIVSLWGDTLATV